MSDEAKVGAFTLAGIGILILVMVLLGTINLGPKTYNIYATFSRAVGLVNSAEVLLSGVHIGRVAGIHVEGRDVVVTLAVNEGIQIPKQSYVTIGSTGIMGEKYVIITPSDATEYVAAEEYIAAYDEMGMDTLFVELNKMTLQIEELLASMNAVVGDKAFQESLVNMAINMEKITYNIESMTAILEAMARENQGNINAIIYNMNETMSSLNRTMTSVENTMTNLERVGADPATAENLKRTLANIAEATERVVRITEGIESVTGDEQVREDAKALINNARNMTDKANNMLGVLGGIDIKPQLDLLYSGKMSDWRTNFNLETGKADTFAVIGVDDIGNGDKLNVQLGKRSKAFGVRAGVVAGEVGAGVDIFAKDRFRLTADVYDPDDVTVRLRAQYRLMDRTYLMGEWNDVNDSRKRAFYAGIRQEF